MVKHFNNNEIERNLAVQDLIIPNGYAPGIPLYTNKGMNIIEKFINIFLKKMDESSIDYVKYNPYKLIDAKLVKQVYKEINDYSAEMLHFKNYNITSDALVQSLLKIKNNRDKGYLSISSIFRDKGNHLTTLYKEKNIFPVIQLDQGLSFSNTESSIDNLKKMYKSFYKALGIPIRFLEAQEVPNYAKKEIYFLSSDEFNLTKLGMIYHLSNKFNENMNITKNINIVNSGFSGRSLFELLKSYSSYIGQFSIPYILNEEKVVFISVLPKKTKEINKKLKENGINYEEWEYTKNFYKKWYKDIYSILLLEHNNFTVYIKGIGNKEFKNINHAIQYIKNYLKKTYTDFYEYNKKKLENILFDYEEYYCADCWSGSYYGTLELEISNKCSKCGTQINKSIFNFDKNNRFY